MAQHRQVSWTSMAFFLHQLFFFCQKTSVFTITEEQNICSGKLIFEQFTYLENNIWNAKNSDRLDRIQIETMAIKVYRYGQQDLVDNQDISPASISTSPTMKWVSLMKFPSVCIFRDCQRYETYHTFYIN